MQHGGTEPPPSRSSLVDHSGAALPGLHWSTCPAAPSGGAVGATAAEPAQLGQRAPAPESRPSGQPGSGRRALGWKSSGSTASRPGIEAVVGVGHVDDVRERRGPRRFHDAPLRSGRRTCRPAGSAPRRSARHGVRQSLAAMAR